MPHLEFNWLNNNGLNIFAQLWQPETQTRAILCLVHGHGEHSSRYAHVAGALNQAGYALITFDQQGHGQSDGPRGDMPAYDALLDDIDQFLQQAGQRFPDRPCFLYGHSMGGNLVLNYVLRRQPQLKGVIATSPWLQLAFAPPAWLLYTVRFFYKVWPSFTMPSGLETAAISRDPAVVIAYEQDPLIHNRISARQLMQVAEAGEWALEHASEFSLPLLLMQGSADRIISAAASRQFADLVSVDCTFKLWPDFYHEIHNEPEQQEMIAFMIKWLQSQGE